MDTNKNYFAATPSSLIKLQLTTLVVILLGVFLVDFSWLYLAISVLFFYAYSVVGISMMMHRYYTHKSFELHNATKWVLTVFAVLAGRGSPIGWVYVHRLHHATSDTEKDPHSPHYDTFKFIGFKPVYDDSKKINYFIVKELLTPAHIKIDKYYMLLIISFALILALIDLNLVFYVWALPVFLVSVSQIAFNYFCHMNGYRNFVTKDQSTNNVFMWPLILGDAWHNNHHAHADWASTKFKWWEIDPVVWLIKLVKVKNKLTQTSK
jgi:stearoyl-CoA desaturase (delta-9 desaturase)